MHEPGPVERVAMARTTQKRLLAQLIELRGRYAEAYRDYCGAYAAARRDGVHEWDLNTLDCPPLDPRHDPFLRDRLVPRSKPA